VSTDWIQFAEAHDIKARISSFRTDEDKDDLYEVHHQFIDVYVCLSGGECVFAAEVGNVSEDPSYDSQKDTAFRHVDAQDGVAYHMRVGSILILFPGAAHLPCQPDGQHGHVKKTIVKIPHELFE